MLSDSYDVFWSVDGRRTYSKMQAMIWANGNDQLVKFHWMENTWDQVDFTKEPVESWAGLCAQRAQQIRDSFSWLCLWFSGGFDSYTILTAFASNHIPLDEIVIWDQTSFFDDGETRSAEIIAQEYKKNHNPNVKITRVDLGWDYVKSHLCSRQDWLTAPGDSLRITRTYWGDRRDYAVKITGSKQNRADIYGAEKPKLDIYQGQWRTFMPDVSFGPLAGSGAVQFFCSQDLPELHVKQVYMAIRFMEQNQISDSDTLHRLQDLNDGVFYRDFNLAIGRTSPINPASIMGTQKKLATSTTPLAGKDKLIVQHAQQTQDQAWQVYLKGLNDLKDLRKNWDPWTTSESQEQKWPVYISKFYNVISTKQRKQYEIS
jgi:hypothetical protein